MDNKRYKEELEQYRQHLLSLAARNLKPVLMKRISPEDIVQETLATACTKDSFFEENKEIPLYFKLRMLLFQTITDIERSHLQAKKRDAFKELEIHPLEEAIDDENDWLRFVPEGDGTYKNVFKGTVEEIFKNVYFQSIHGGSPKYSVYNVVDPDTGDTYDIAEQNRLRLKAASCSRTAMLCGTILFAPLRIISPYLQSMTSFISRLSFRKICIGMHNTIIHYIFGLCNRFLQIRA